MIESESEDDVSQYDNMDDGDDSQVFIFFSKLLDNSLHVRIRQFMAHHYSQFFSFLPQIYSRKQPQSF